MSWAETKKINSNMSLPLNEGGVKIVKKVQYGQITIASSQKTATATISAVDPSKAVLIVLGVISGKSASGSDPGASSPSLNWDSTVSLNNSTTISAQRAITVTYTAIISYCIVEYY